jgi:hypothetical protein
VKVIMKLVNRTGWGAIIMAGLLPALGCGLVGEWGLALLFLLLAGGWLLLIRYKATVAEIEILAGFEPAPYALVLNVVLLVYAAWLGVAAGWLLLGLAAIIAAWDLDAFQQRLRRATRIVQERQLIQTHLRRLLWALALGLGLSGMALLIQYEMRFGWGLLLILLAIFGFSQIIRTLRDA